MRILAALAVVCCVYAGAPMRSGANLVKWKEGRLSIQVSRTVHMAESETGVDRRESAASVHTAVMEAVHAWSHTAKAGVSIEVQFTDDAKLEPGRSLITFTDTAPFDDGLCDKNTFLACTILRFAEDTGELDSVGIAFNPYLRHSSIGLKGTHDLGLVILHEIGHALGLDHSPLQDAVMSAYVELATVEPGGDFGVRELSSDDMMSLAMLYPPAPSEEAQPGRIRGTVRRNGEALAGAHVFAINRHGHPVHSAVTMDEGVFELLVPAGEYRILAEPLDGPALVAQMASPPPRAPKFPTLMWNTAGGHATDGMTVAVEAGQSREAIDFTVPDTRLVNVDTIGMVESGRYLGGPRVFMGRGRQYMLGLTRTPAEGPPSVRIPSSPVENDGQANSPSSAPQLVRQRVKVNADGRLGAYVVKYLAEQSVSVMAGSLRVVPSPAVEGVRDSSTGAEASAYKANQLISISGADLAARTSASTPWQETAARPTQLGGASVRIGDRWAPLFAVTPHEIVAAVPEGLEGATVTLRVVTGAGVESQPLALRLVQ